MARGGSDTIEAIKARLNIVDIVRRYVDLRQVGDRWAGVCPFHQETKPSLSVHPEKGFYYCFGCQASGDLIDFYRDINGLEFRQALEELAREAGVDLDDRPDPKAAQRQAERRASLEMQSLAQRFFQATLEAVAGKQAREYLAARGVDRRMQDYFGLGFAPEGWQALGAELQRNGYTLQQGVTAGLLSQNRNGRIYDRFRNRVTFPIHDLGGKVIAFGGRVIGDGEPKYLNSSDSPIYKKGAHLYGLYQARQAVTQSKEVLLTEGYADVIALVRYGFTHACGVLGTALTAEQVRRLAGLARRVTLIYDGDRAGRQAASRSAEMLLRQGVQCRVVNLPDGEDVDSLLQQSGAAGFQRFVREAEEGLTFCLRVLRESGVAREILHWATEFLQGLQDRTWQAYFLPRVAAGLELSETELRRALDGGGRSAAGARSHHRSEHLQQASPGQRDRELLHFAISCPQYCERLDVLGLEQALATERGRQLWRKIKSFSREELLLHLDASEKRFYIQSELHPLPAQRQRAVWEGIEQFLHKTRQEVTLQEVRTALKHAQESGDAEEMDRLLRAYTDMLGGLNE